MNLKHTLLILAATILGLSCRGAEKPWSHGELKVSDNGLFLQHEDGTPFFWLGDTGWLLPQRLDRDESQYYLEQSAREGFNVVQVQVLNGVPSFNRYGSMSHPDGWNLSAMSKPGEYGYWEHLDHIIDTAGRNGIYIGMVCIWGGLVKNGLLTEEQAEEYGRFLADRYKDRANIIWIIGGDIQGDVKTPVWDALDLSKISGEKKNIWMMDPTDGSLTYLGMTNDKVFGHTPEPGKDMVLIAVDSRRDYITPGMSEIPEKKSEQIRDLTE